MKKHSFDNSLLEEFSAQSTLIAGVDEVGRGALFGSVVAATVVVPISAVSCLINLGVNDSKKLSPRKRQELVIPIQEICVDWAIGCANVAEIDQLNILQASLLAMKRCLTKLQVTPDVCLVDGKFAIPNLDITQKTVIKGDLRSPIIAAASILAKVSRDELIVDLAQTYQEYNLASNKGYPTAQHLSAIKQYGITPEHRRSFKSCQEFT
ncbi:MAG: ribonuclease HII [Cyanobacteria bacterium P01_G01_bin.67]